MRYALWEEDFSRAGLSAGATSVFWAEELSAAATLYTDPQAPLSETQTYRDLGEKGGVARLINTRAFMGRNPPAAARDVLKRCPDVSGKGPCRPAPGSRFPYKGVCENQKSSAQTPWRAKHSPLPIDVQASPGSDAGHRVYLSRLPVVVITSFPCFTPRKLRRWSASCWTSFPRPFTMITSRQFRWSRWTWVTASTFPW